MRLANVLSACALLSVLSAAKDSGASQSFPAEVQRVTHSAVTPPCTVCHTSLAGGYGTAKQPLGMYLHEHCGLVGKDVTTVEPALACDQGANHISRSGGLPDIEALKDGIDPNGPSPYPPPPDYGCGASVASSPAAAKALPVALFALVLGVARRRKAARGASA